MIENYAKKYNLVGVRKRSLLIDKGIENFYRLMISAVGSWDSPPDGRS